MKYSRNYTIDTLRTLAALSVIAIHTNYSNFYADSLYIHIIKLCARWAVPYFFLISGYFFERKSRLNLDNAFLSSLKSLLLIFIIANIFYSLIAAQTEFYTISDVFSIRSIIIGDFYHLWFIGSLIFGYMMLWLILSLNLYRLLLPASLLILLALLVIGPYGMFPALKIEGYFVRFFLSIPLLFIGFIYSKSRLDLSFNKILSLSIIVTGIVIAYIEEKMLYAIHQHTDFNPEFLLGIIIFSIGIFTISFSNNIVKDNILSKVGRDYSLLIYLYHPAVIVVIFFVIKKLGYQNTNYLLWFNPITIFVITLLPLGMTSRIAPLVFRVISGKL
jgi:surface polysaccharide O-acyltransferase-like enzyme